MIRLGHGKWIAIEFKPQDCWIGIYWTTKDVRAYSIVGGLVVAEWHLWVCIIPCVPVHFIRAIMERREG